MLAWLALGGAACVLAVFTLGVPGTFILVGAWMLAIALGRTIPGLSGATSWAAAVIVEIGLLTAMSAALAVASPRPHGRALYLIVLAIPAILGAAGCIWSRSDHGTHVVVRLPQRGALAITVGIVALGIARWIASLGKNYGIAWAMSGDARNHVLIARAVLHDGGLTIRELRSYPALINDLIGQGSGAGGRDGLSPGQLLLHDASALAVIYVVSGIAIGVLFIAALLELLPRATATKPRLPPSITLVALASAATSASPLVLGTALIGGFVTAYATIPLLLACIVLALRFCTEPLPWTLVLLGSATILTLFSWPPIAIVPAILIILLGLIGLAQRHAGAEFPKAPKWAWIAAIIISLGALGAALVIVVVEWRPLRSEFASPGAIVAPEMRILYLLGLVAVGSLFAVKKRSRRLQYSIPILAVIIGVIAVKWLLTFPASYYGTKSLWLLMSCLLWVAFVPALISVTGNQRGGGDLRWSEPSRVIQAGAWSAVALIVIGLSTTVGNPLTSAKRGWSQPSAAVVTETVAAGDEYHRFATWDWSDASDDRLGNFWAALEWDSSAAGDFLPGGPGLPQGFASWAYTETGNTSQLCALAEGTPHLVIVTSNRSLTEQLKETCPKSGARIVVGHAPT